MKRIQCIIVDDEPLARELISTYVSRLEGWELIKSYRSPIEAYEALYQHDIDVMFLDIQMPVISGIEFLSSLKRAPGVIFTTAHPEFAVSAFDLKAIDYLLKPITEERFLQAIEKVKAGEPPITINQPAGEIDYIFLKQNGRLVKVLFTDILYIEALKDFSKVFLKVGSMLVGSHLKQLEDQLPGNKFFRLHRSYIVALHAITALQGNTLEIGRTAIPIGGMYKEELLKRLKV
jgi:two-component system LytT family response regulator